MATKIKANPRGKLVIRNSTLEDIPQMQEVAAKVYTNWGTYPAAMLTGQIHAFPEGQFVATYAGKVVGFCSTFMIDEKIALKAHNWTEITGGGYASRHDPNGNILDGMEVAVDPEYRGYRIGQRLYDARKKLCIEYELKAIVFSGRVPDLHKKIKKVKDIHEYISKVKSKKMRDPTLSFQLRNHFEIVMPMENYLPNDKDSLGWGILMKWQNPKMSRTPAEDNKRKLRIRDSVRVATVQYMQRKVDSFEQFINYVQYFVNVASDSQADFVVFPEFFSLQLLSIENEKLKPEKAIESLTKYDPMIIESLRDMAIKYNINIIGGSHPTKSDDNRIKNTCHIFLRDGSVHSQEKIHITPNEVYWWNIEGGDSLKTIETDCGTIGILICYDAEFPELSRHLVDQGATILFVPYCTESRQGHLRVRYCCQARAVENQCFIVTSGNVGNLPGVENMDIQYAQSCIITPNDFPFARDGIAADTTPNAEMVAMADLRLDDLRLSRNTGTVRNLQDRRHDLYQVVWKKD